MTNVAGSLDLDLYIGGRWSKAGSTERNDMLHPATGEMIGSVPSGDAMDVDRSICSAEEAFHGWRKVPTRERVWPQYRAAALMRERADELSHLPTLELGRPLAGAGLENERVANLLDDYAEEALRLREPVGVVVAIAPFNYPINLLAFKLGAALPVGCTVVAKPAEDTPLTTLKLAELFTEAGFPPGCPT